MNNCKPTKTTLKKHRIIQKLCGDSSIVILKPDKGNVVVVLDNLQCGKAISDIINDKTKVKELSNNVTKKREEKLQRLY